MPHPNSNYPDQWGWQHGDAADIVPFSYGGHVFYNGVARGTEQLFKLALDTIVPRIPGGIYQAHDAPGVDDGTWGYEDRISRNSSAISFHAFGLALDINAVQNPNATAEPDPSPYRLPQNTGQLLDDACGAGMFRFGGDWGDWMHIEIHGSPAEVAAWNASHGKTSQPAGTGGAVHPTTPPSTQGDTNDMADITPAQMDQIATKVVEKLLGTSEDWDGPGPRGAGSLASLLGTLQSAVVDIQQKASELVDARNHNVDGTK